MNRRHQTALDAEAVIQHLGDRRQTVRRAGRIRDDGLAGIRLVVDAEDEHRRVVLGRCRHDDLLGAGADVLLRGLFREEQTRRLDDDVGADFVPFQLGRILDRGETNLLAVDDQRVAIDGNRALELTVDRVVLQHVREIVRLEQIVDAHDLDIREVLRRCSKHHAPDATETIDADFDGHARSSLLEKALGTRHQALAG